MRKQRVFGILLLLLGLWSAYMVYHYLPPDYGYGGGFERLAEAQGKYEAATYYHGIAEAENQKAVNCKVGFFALFVFSVTAGGIMTYESSRPKH